MRAGTHSRSRAFPTTGLGAALTGALLVVLTAGCVETVDVKQALEVTLVETGYFDAGIVNGKNRLLPSCTVQIKNISGSTVRSVQLNAVFRRPGDPEEMGAAFAQAIDSSGLEAGQSTKPIVLNSQFGYTGEQPRADMLKHKLFVDARVEIFAKQGGAQYVKLAEFDVERRVLTAQTQ